ncbi:MAG: SLBB domain-containing protein [Legionella sp.]|jgi:protein involved in polysaccharide export with SLBB domain
MTRRLIPYIILILISSLASVFASSDDEKLYPGNLINFSLVGSDAISKDFRIDPHGVILLPDVGSIDTNGETLNSLRTKAIAKLSYIYKNADSLVLSKKDSKIYVVVLGYVVKPGTYLVGPNDSMQIAIEKAGGMLDGAQMNQLQLRRNNTTSVIDYKQYLNTGDAKLLPPLMANDELFVPTSKLMGNVKVDGRYLIVNQQGDASSLTDSIKILGAVGKPGAYTYNPKFTVVDYLLKAGGTTQYAQTDQIKIVDSTGAFSFNLREYMSTAQKDLMPKISSGSTIFVPLNNEVAKPGSATAYVMGQVQHPGAYPLTNKSTFMDLVANAGGPDHYAETRKIRIIHPDKKVAYFDMQAFTEGLSKESLPTLQSGDVIYFPLKTDLNEKSWLDIAPNRSIKIIGAVVRPGRYEWASEMNIMDLISNVGGPTKDADTTRIRIISPESQIPPTDFNLKEFIEKGMGKDGLPKIAAGYTIAVPEVAKAPLNIQKSVKIIGEVYKPGVYAFDPKLTAVDYLLMAGGITHYASPSQIKIIDNSQAIVFNLQDYLDSAKTSNMPVINQGATIFVPVVSDKINANKRTVYVMGQVQKPGAYDLGKNATFMDSVANAGGPDHYAETRKIRIIHPDKKVEYFDMQAFTEGLTKIGLPILQAGDVIYFPLKTDLNEKSWLDIAPKRSIKIMGAVTRPGRYEWADEMSILDALANVGGPTVTADTAHIKILSNDGTSAPTEFNLKKALETGVGSSPLPVLKGGYTIFVPEMVKTPLNMQKSIKVFGEVYKPGAYNFNSNYSAIDYILAAGGTTHYAAPDQIRIIDNNNSNLFDLKTYLDTAKPGSMPKINEGATIFIPVDNPSNQEVKSDSRTVYVMGQVQKPGRFELGKNATFLDALANAGGPDHYAETRKIRLISKTGAIHYFDMQAYTEGLSTAKLPELLGGDVIYIPIKTDLNEKSWLQVAPNHAVKVIGAVIRPGRYEWSDEMSLIDVLAHAGGPNSEADIANIRIISNEHDKNGKLRSVQFNLNKFVEKGGDVSIIPVIRAGYTIEVPTLPRSPIDNKAIWTQQDPKTTIYVFGEVGQPGRYNFNDQLNFLDILSAANGPTEKADLRDVHVIDRQGVYPQVIHVNLALYFETGDAELIPKVLPGDAIYVPQKNKDYTETNTRHVIKILGEVKNPGRYRYASNMTILDLLAAAGGPTTQALVSKILVINMGTKLETQASTFNLLKFSKSGDLSMLPALREGDVIYVPNNDEDFRKQFAQVLQNLANAAVLISAFNGFKV